MTVDFSNLPAGTVIRWVRDDPRLDDYDIEGSNRRKQQYLRRTPAVIQGRYCYDNGRLIYSVLWPNGARWYILPSMIGLDEGPW